MNKYEVMYIINATLDEEATKAVIDRFSTLVTENGGTVDKLDEWGKRKLAYLIDDMAEGYYVLMFMTAEPTFPAELERNFKINDNIMRYMVTRLDDEEK